MTTDAPRRRGLSRATDREHAPALYEQVKEFITRKIQAGEWSAGDRLPSEHELVAQLGISRMTVNRAFRELREQGRVVRLAGIGSFVAEEKPQSTLLQIANIASEIRQRGHDYRFEMLAAERIAAPPDVAAWMDLAPLGVTKASGLELVRRALHVQPHRTVAVGDGHNDVEMLQWAARGVAMGHADDAVQAAADEVTGSIADDGAVPVLRSLLN